MLILAKEFSQAVYLAREVSEPNKTAVYCSFAHTHTHTRTQWKVSGYQGNLSAKYAMHPPGYPSLHVR